MVKAIFEKEISVETPNTIGTAAKLTQLISKQANANIRAAWASGTNGQGHFSLITNNNQKVMDVLKNEFPQIKENEILVVSVPNDVGKIAEVTNQITQAGLNINYFFTTYFENNPAIVISTNDNKKALNLFNH